MRAGVIRNPRAHRNSRADAKAPSDGAVLWASPDTREALRDTLLAFADAGVERLVVDGGDGTIREVLSAAAEAFPTGLPLLAVLPNGKTNALALDLGARPGRWSLQSAFDSTRTRTRTPIEILRDGAVVQRGFVFGVGAYVKALGLAQRANRAGLFDSLAVGVVLAQAALRSTLGGDDDTWRTGVGLSLSRDGAATVSGPRFLLLASTLKRFPLKLRPFGSPRQGLKLLDVAAPPRRLAAALPAILSGASPAWLDGAGYARRDVETLDLVLDGEVVLDGEIFPGGALTLRRGAPVTFVTP